MSESDPRATSTVSASQAPPVARGVRATPAHAPDAAAARRDALRGALILIAMSATCILVYLAFAVPGTWFPRASPRSWNAQNLELARGGGSVAGDELVVAKPDANGIAIVTVTTDFRAQDYPGVAWIVTGLREDADVRLLWRADYRPDKLNSTPLRVEAGHTLPAQLADNREWIGRVTGLALAIHDPLAHPVRIRGVIAKPMGAVETVRDRLGEWFAFEAWNGASINTLTGGADNQDVPLPAVLALAVALSAVVVVLVRRRWPAAFSVAAPTIVAGLFLVGWWVLDARWTWNLVRQERATAAQYAGKDARDKHLASDDGPLFAFIERARGVLPHTPVRIFVAADADYFRGRAAYHLYPNRVYFSPRSNELPPATAFRSGDWLLVFLRHGIQFDKASGRIRWDGNQTVDAELKLVEPGAALFVIR